MFKDFKGIDESMNHIVYNRNMSSISSSIVVLHAKTSLAI